MLTGGIATLRRQLQSITRGASHPCAAVAEQLGLSRVVLIPSATPPHKLLDAELADAADRLEMVRLAIAGEPGFEASDIEIRRQAPATPCTPLQGFREAARRGHTAATGSSGPTA